MVVARSFATGPDAVGEPDIVGTPAPLDAAPARNFAWSGHVTDERMRWFTDGLRITMLAAGYRELDAAGPDASVVFHLVDHADVRPYRRRSAPTFVVALVALDEPPADPLRVGYPLLVQGLANLAMMVSPHGSGSAVHFVTPEQGVYALDDADSAGDGPGADFFAAVFDRLEPLASSRLVIANEFAADLPPELWAGNDETAQITRAGARLAALDLLPAAFPIEELLSPRDLRHVKLMYGIGGLSYGNLSVRRRTIGRPAAEPQFWMSASGVDKSSLRDVGRDILLVAGYDETRGVMQLQVPPGIEPRRVSVDAIEHWIIYREHPAVGAILHVHAWIEGTVATTINYPCGTVELATSVAELIRRSPDPSRAVVGQRNHGLTITGHSLDEIFTRVDGTIVRTVPMS